MKFVDKGSIRRKIAQRMSFGGLQVTKTRQLGAFLETCWQKKEGLDGELKTSLAALMEGSGSESVEEEKEEGVSFALVKALVAWRREEAQKAGSKESLYLHEVLQGVSYFNPPPQVVAKDPEYVARMEKLRHQVENRLYAKMVANVSAERLKAAEIEDRADLKTGLDTAKLAGNLLMSVVAVFAATYFILHNTYHNTMLSISGSSITAIGIFMVEVILFVLRGSRLDSHVAQTRSDIHHGIASPFPATAPSILDAQRKIKEEQRAQRIEAKKLALLSNSPSNQPTTPNAASSDQNPEPVLPLLTAEPTSSSNSSSPSSNTSSARSPKKMTSMPFNDILAQQMATAGGPVIEDL